MSESTLNEFESFMNFEDSMAELDKALTEPFIAKSLAMATEWNKLLTTDTLSGEESTNLIGYFDYEWGSLLGMPLQVTGYVTHLDANGDIVTRFYEDATMVSNGFVITPPPDEDNEPTPGQRIVLAFYIPIPEDEMEIYAEGGIVGTHLTGTAEVDSVNVAAEVGMSPERTRAWLGAFTPDVIDDIDAAVFSSDGSIGDIVARVQELELIPQCTPDEFRRACVGVAVYLKSIIDFHTNLPYLASMSGRASVTDDEGYDSEARVRGSESFIYIRDVSVAFLDDDSMKEDTFSLNIMDHVYLNVVVINNGEGDDMPIRIPFDTIISIESIKPLVESGL